MRRSQAESLYGDQPAAAVLHPDRLFDKQPEHKDVERLLQVGIALTALRWICQPYSLSTDLL